MTAVYLMDHQVTTTTTSVDKHLLIRERTVKRRVSHASQLTQLIEQCQAYHRRIFRLQLRHLSMQTNEYTCHQTNTPITCSATNSKPRLHGDNYLSPSPPHSHNYFPISTPSMSLCSPSPPHLSPSPSYSSPSPCM